MSSFYKSEKFPVIVQGETRQGGRAENQDTAAWNDTPAGFFVTVCDGMGGGPSGKTASMLAADAISKTLLAATGTENRVELVRQAVHNANATIYAAMDANPELRGMGSTATVLLLNADSAVVAHVGDSRVYQLRDGKKVFRTFDHSWVFEQVKQGTLTEEQARNSSQSNIITRALGHTTDLEVDVVELPYLKGDRFMLCSDGIWGMFPEPEIIRDATETASLAGTVEKLVIRVDEEGVRTGNTHDNLTVAIAETTTDSKLKEPMRKSVIITLATLAVLLCASLALNCWLWYRTSRMQPAAAPQTNIEQLAQNRVDSIAEGLSDNLNERMKQFEADQAKKYKATLDSILTLISSQKYEEAKQVVTAEQQRLAK